MVNEMIVVEREILHNHILFANKYNLYMIALAFNVVCMTIIEQLKCSLIGIVLAVSSIWM